MGTEQMMFSRLRVAEAWLRHCLRTANEESPLFRQFLKERYDGGKGRVVNPNQQSRGRYPDVAFRTAWKSEDFRVQVWREFEAWKEGPEESVRSPKMPPEERPRLEIGQVVESVSTLRPGDVIRRNDRKGAPYNAVVEHRAGDDVVVLRELDEDGSFGEPWEMPSMFLEEGKHTRVEDPRAGKKERDQAAARARAEQQRAREEKAEALRERFRERQKNFPPWRRNHQELLDVALQGRVAREQRLGGEDDNLNISVKRTMRRGSLEADFVWKPADGERNSEGDGGARRGIRVGTYHAREAAAYAVDALFGEGTVVPPTVSNGKGSYQAFERGAETLMEVSGPVKNDQLRDNPDFHRLLFLDQVLGNEDRHSGNVMCRREANKLRLFAIDNGLSLVDPNVKRGVGDYLMQDPWAELQGEGLVQRWGMVRDTLTDVPNDLHERMRQVKMEDFVDALVASGVEDTSAIRAAAVRLAAIQRNSRVLLKYMNETGPPTVGCRMFQYASGAKPAEVLEDAGGEGPTLEDIDAAISRSLR